MSEALETWSVDAGDADIALLVVPPALGRTRRFLIDVRFVVRCPDAPAGHGPWHALTVEIDGRREWSRTIPTHCPGPTDSLDFQRIVEVPEGQGLRVRAAARVQGARRDRLCIEAQEQ